MQFALSILFLKRLCLPIITIYQVIETEKAQKLAEKYGLAYFETSAKTGYNVDEAFIHLARDVKKRLSEVSEEEKEEQASKQKGVHKLGESGSSSSSGQNGSAGSNNQGQGPCSC